jgi:protein-S-isoprenylcysteine O-methyltransferase Ste14
MQKEIQHSAPLRLGVKVIAVVCYVTAGAGLAALLCLLAALGMGLLHVSSEPAIGWAWASNLGLVALFGVQHSVMARDGFKRQWMRFVPAALEQAIYAALSGTLLLGLCYFWQPLGGPEIWHLPDVFAAVALAGGCGLMFITLGYNHLGLVGVGQVWRPDDAAKEQLRIVGPYRWVRHPLMSCTLVLLWGWPVMSPTLAVLSGGLTLYIFVALPLEENTLIARFGDAYRDYRRRVPAYLPWRGPVPRAVIEVSP